MRNTVKKRRPPVIRLMNLFTVIAALLLVISLIHLVSELRSAFVRDRFGTIEYSLEDGNYGQMVSQYYRMYYDAAPFSSPYEPAYQTAAYADAAFHHQFFTAVGNHEAAARWAQRMEDARLGMGELAVVAPDVDEVLDAVTLYP